MKEIGPIVGIDHIAGIDCKSTIQMTIEMTTKKKIIDCEIIIKEIEPIAETGHIVETDQGITTKEIDHNIFYRNNKRDRSYSTDRSYSRDRLQGYYYKNDYRNDYKKENHRDFKNQRHERRSRDYYEGAYEDRYIKDKDSNKYRYRYRDDSYDKIKHRSKEKDYLCDDDDDDIFHSKIERVHKSLQTMSQEKEMATGFMLAFSENPDKILDNICSPADVDHLIAERIEYAKSQKVENENLTKDPNVNVSITSSQNYVNPVDYESINEDTDLTQDSVNTVSEFVEGKVGRCYIETTIIGNSNREEEVQIQNIEEGNIMVDLHDEIDLCELE